MPYRLVLPALLLAYVMFKHRLTAREAREPGEGEVLYPRQDAKFIHGAMTGLEAVFVLEFVSHAARYEAAFLRLGATLAVLILVDLVYWLKLKNTMLRYDRQGITARDILGREVSIPWAEVQEVHTSGSGVRSARFFTLKTARGSLKINAKSGGLERFRQYMEKNL